MALQVDRLGMFFSFLGGGVGACGSSGEADMARRRRKYKAMQDKAAELQVGSDSSLLCAFYWMSVMTRQVPTSCLRN